ncbi:MAG: GNAT family N-acetyltransferase [Acidobacteriota bacterium]|jgi:GNAT superfamily N-acetyltransferase
MAPKAESWKFDRSYREYFTLRDETRVLIRCLRAEDREKILEGFDHLSSTSRYLRFLTPKPLLSDEELRFFTEIDGLNHFGIVAVETARDGSEGPGVAVARFLRLADDPASAEPAITVVDEMQGQGVGKALFERLVAAARERGIRRFRCYILAENRRGQELVHYFFPTAHFELRGEVFVAEFPITGVPKAGRG